MALVRASDSRLRKPGFDSSAAGSSLGLIASLCIAPVHSATDSGGYLCTNSLRALNTAWLDASQRN